MIDTQVFGERIAAFLRAEHPSKTALSVEGHTGISAKTVEKWLQGASAPSGAAYHQLIKVYGPELFVYVSPDASSEVLKNAARISRQHRLEQRAATIRQQLADVMGGR
ncbi:hypothetical protein [Methylobacterium organophilum]|uniref:hypothetical protein n=1 Tax=Methylobacterium organophilum TaxID=410 RepID=UPI001EE1BEEF|nr:hypothetical protein [Methylobacterium organophilum]